MAKKQTTKTSSTERAPHLTLQAIALADQVITADDGKKSVIGIFDKIFVRSVPATHARMVLFLSVVGPVSDTAQLELMVTAPSGMALEKKEISFDLGSNGKANIIINLEGFPIKETGAHEVVVSEHDTPIGSYAFDVIRVENQQEKPLVG